MSHGVKLAFFFAVSLALHAAGLWAAAGHFEPRAAEPVAEVALVDRDLFFRHAERGETRASAPVAVDERLSPALPRAAPSSQAQASLDRAQPEAAAEAEPDRRAAQTAAPRAMARLDQSRVEPSPPPRRDAAALEAIDAGRSDPGEAEKRAPERMSGIAAAPPPASVTPEVQHSTAEALRAGTSERVASAARRSDARPAVAPQLQATADAAEAARARAAAPEAAPGQPVRRPLETEAELSARAAEPLARTAAEAPAREAADVIANAPADSPPPLAPERSEAEAAPPLAAAESARVEPPTRAAAGETARAATAPPLAARPIGPATDAPAPMPSEPERLAARGSIAIGRAQADPAPSPALERNESEDAPPVAAAETARLERSGTAAPTAPSATAPPPGELDRLAALEPRPALRGTLPPPLIAPREARSATAGGTPALAPAPADSSRLRASQPSEPARSRDGLAAVRSEPAPPAERLAARPPRPAPSVPPAPDPAPPPDAPPELAALDPATAARRVDASDEPAAGRDKSADWFIRSYPGGECFFPVRVASSDDDALLGYGVEAESVRLFRDAFAQALGDEADIEWRPLTDAQCSGISFARLILGGTAPSLEIGLERKELEPGVALAGRVSGSEFDFVTLLVVDDSGVVHNVLEYLRARTAELAFSVPVHPVDEGTDRVQLIMAVGASVPLPALQSTTPMHSDDFFPELLRQARQAGAALELGLEDFVILEGRL